MSATVEIPNSMSQNFWHPEVLTQIAGSSGTYENFTTSAKMNFKCDISYNATSKWLGRHVGSLP